jgi:hypothetical protein
LNHPPRILKQLSILAMSDGFKRMDIAAAVGVDPKTVTAVSFPPKMRTLVKVEFVP